MSAKGSRLVASSARPCVGSKSRQPLLENLEPRLLLTTVSVALSTTEIQESGGAPAVFTVSRDNTVGNLTVNYRVGGSEPIGKIAQSLTGTLVIPAGSTSATISATPIDDGLAGYNNTLTIELLAPDGGGYSLGAVSQGTVRIDESDSLLGTYITVGPGKQYADPWAALYNLGANNVIIDVWPSATGTYWMPNAAVDARNGKVYYDNITIRGIGAGRVKTFSDPSTTIANDEGIFLLKSGHTGLTLENLDIEGARGPSNNDAGLRVEAGDFTVRNCYFSNNQDGILGGTTGSNILIEYSEFYDNGNEPGRNTNGGTSQFGYTHNLYLAGNTLTFQYNVSHDSATGHLLKSRCLTNYILYNRFQGEGQESFEVSTPDAGKTYIVGNVIHQGPNSQNGAIIDYASEGAARAGDFLYIVGNTVVNDRSGGTFIQANNIPAGFNVTIKDNIFAGSGTPWTLGGGVTPVTAGNVINSIAALNFVNAAATDYHLLAGSPAIGAGVDPGTSSEGYSLAPTMEYVNGGGVKPRPISTTWDAGAYDYLPPDTTAPTSWASVDHVAITLAAADVGSGVQSIKYQVNSGSWLTYAAPFSVLAGDSVNYYAQDVAGNVGTTNLVTVPLVGGDANKDGYVNVVDLGVLAKYYDTASGATWAMADFSNDGKVDVVDLGVLAKYYDYGSAGGPAGQSAASDSSGTVSTLSAPVGAAALLAPAAAPVATTTITPLSAATMDVASLLDSAAAIGTVKGKQGVRVRRSPGHAMRVNQYVTTAGSLL